MVTPPSAKLESADREGHRYIPGSTSTLIPVAASTLDHCSKLCANGSGWDPESHGKSASIEYNCSEGRTVGKGHRFAQVSPELDQRSMTSVDRVIIFVLANDLMVVSEPNFPDMVGTKKDSSRYVYTLVLKFVTMS